MFRHRGTEQNLYTTAVVVNKPIFNAGESVLHMAIVNEDPAMVKVLMDSGADLNERCFGNFMSTEDQKASRSDSLDHEWVNLCPDTNYEG